MNLLPEKIKNHAAEAEAVWGLSYSFFSRVIEKKKLKIGVEIGVAYGGHSESILKTATIDRLYGIDPYLHMKEYEDPMNLTQEEFDQLYFFVLKRLAPFGDRYQHIRKLSKDAVNDIPTAIDFVYIDADHSYQGVWEDLCAWFPKVRVGGAIGGHDYAHPNHSGVKQAIDEFFRRFGWKIHEEGEGVWWVEKKELNISFIMPAYNCATTVEESVKSIMDGNFQAGDELVIVNDCSTDNTESVLNNLKTKYPEIKIITHTRNKGGGAARNTAVGNTQNQILFCLDSDNILVPESIQKLKAFMQNSGADVASFQELRYFQDNKDKVTHKWIFRQGITTLVDYLSGPVVPGSSGNYMFTKESWVRAGGYPDFTLLDTWGFGLRQVATGSKMLTLPNSYYFHRYGHESYWMRENRKGKTSLEALQILIPFIDLINDRDVDYIMSRRGRRSWFNDEGKHPIRLKSGEIGRNGKAVDMNGNPVQNRRLWKSSLRAKIIGAFSCMLPHSIKKIIRGMR